MIFRRHVKIREEKFGAVVFETMKEKVFVANETGKAIVSLILKGLPENRIASELARAYKGDRARIENDVREFIAELKEKGLLCSDEDCRQHHG